MQNLNSNLSNISEENYNLSISHFIASEIKAEREWIVDDLNIKELDPDDFIVFSRVANSNLSGLPFGYVDQEEEQEYEQFTVLIQNRLFQMEEVKIKNEKNSEVIEVHYIISSMQERVKSISRDDEKVLGKLSDREIEVLTLMALGNSMSKIAKMLFLSPYTIDSHRLNLCRKLQVRRTTQLAVWAYKLGLLDRDDNIAVGMA